MTHRRPYMLPPLLAGVEAGRSVEYTCREAIRRAWREGKPTHECASIKAAREAFGRFHTPAELNAIVHALVAYDRKPWPDKDAEGDAKVEWLRRGRQPIDEPGTGTYYESRIAVRYAISAAVSILLEVPIEREPDESALLQTLCASGWAVPRHQRKRVAQRFARYIQNRIDRAPFVSVEAGACA